MGVAEFIRSKDVFGKSCMHYAATFGFVDLIYIIYDECKVVVRDTDFTKQTPLHCAGIQVWLCDMKVQHTW